jgi:hypothetical protein
MIENKNKCQLCGGLNDDISGFIALSERPVPVTCQKCNEVYVIYLKGLPYLRRNKNGLYNL